MPAMLLIFFILAAGCCFVSTTDGSTIQSPNFPNNYPNYQDKTYSISVQPGQTVEISFETFQLESHGSCIWDWLKVVDTGAGSTLLDKTCGSNLPAKIISKTNKVDILFHSDYSVTRKGFKLQWKAQDMSSEGHFSCHTAPYNPTGVRGAQDANIVLWDGGVIPYEIMDNFQDSDKKTFLKAVQEIEEGTCLRFVPRSHEDAYIKVARNCDCTSDTCTGGGWCPDGKCFAGGWVSNGLGKQRPSELFIGKTCLSPDARNDVSLVLHEILHSLGVVHTQTRPDRDDYIEVLEDNIKDTTNARAQYAECRLCLTYDTKYNCKSVMHYRDYFAQACPTCKTMVKKASNPADCDLHSPTTGLEDSDIDLLNKMYNCKSVWQPILDCFTELALTPYNQFTASKLATKPFSGADNQLWIMDSDGRVVNKQSGLVIEGGNRPDMQPSTPLTSSKQWRVRSDIRSNQETAAVNVPRLVENGRDFCLNTQNRFASQGSTVIMWDAKKIHPDNACWKTSFLDWKPILDCFTGLALTTLGPEQGARLSTKPVTGKDNQMWAFDSKRRIVNKETGLVIDGSKGTQFMQKPTPLTDSKQWHLRTDLRSVQETATKTVPKLVNNGNEYGLNTQNRYASQGSTIIMYKSTLVHPDNACWKF